MADVKTRQINRQKLAQVFKDPELMKTFENVLLDVSTTIPESSTSAQLTANDARARAINAQSDVDQLEVLVATIEAFIYAQRNDRATISALQNRVDFLETQVNALIRRTDIDTLRRQINDLQSLLLAS